MKSHSVYRVWVAIEYNIEFTVWDVTFVQKKVKLIPFGKIR